MSTVGGIMSTLGVFNTPGEYYDKCGGRSLGKQLNLYGNPDVLNIPRYTHDNPPTHHGISQHSSWYSSHFLTHLSHSSFTLIMVSLTLPPSSSWCYPPVYWTTSSVLNDIPQWIEHPSVYCAYIIQGLSKVIEEKHNGRGLQNSPLLLALSTSFVDFDEVTNC